MSPTSNMRFPRNRPLSLDPRPQSVFWGKSGPRGRLPTQRPARRNSGASLVSVLVQFGAARYTRRIARFCWFSSTYIFPRYSAGNPGRIMSPVSKLQQAAQDFPNVVDPGSAWGRGFPYEASASSSRRRRPHHFLGLRIEVMQLVRADRTSRHSGIGQ